MDPLSQVVDTRSPRKIRRILKKVRTDVLCQVDSIFKEALEDPELLNRLIDTDDKMEAREILKGLITKSKVVVAQPLRTNLTVTRPKRW